VKLPFCPVQPITHPHVCALQAFIRSSPHLPVEEALGISRPSVFGLFPNSHSGGAPPGKRSFLFRSRRCKSLAPPSLSPAGRFGARRQDKRAKFVALHGAASLRSLVIV